MANATIDAKDSYLLVAQLSDLHVRSADDACLARVDAVIGALRPLARRATGCLVALTGDLTWSGSESQFEVVATLVDELRESLRINLPGIPIAIAIVPGNHDCDFSVEHAARDAILAAISAAPRVTDDNSVLWTCSRPLTTFHAFASKHTYPPPPPGEPAAAQSFAHLVRLETTDGRAVRVVCANTAWCSHKHEVPASLWFPPEAVPDADATSLTVVLQHHPLQWLEPTNAKQLRSKLEAVADLVLTGHEHEPAGRTVTTSGGEAALYLEGGLFEVTTEAPATFNVIAVTQQRRFCHLTFVWNDDERGFRAAGDTDFLAESGSWPELPLARKRAASTFRLKPSYEEFLDDLGMTIEHPQRGRVSLSDLYTVPDIRELDLIGHTRPRVLTNDKTLGRLAGLGEVLVIGDSQTGKTSLAKRLFLEFREQGFVPVMLANLRKPIFGHGLDKALAKAFTDQYGSPSAATYDQLPPERRAVVIDDFHLMGGKATHRTKFREELRRRATHVVYLAHDMALSIEDLLGFGDDVLARRFQIQPMGHARRAELIERWVSLGEAEDERRLARSVHETTRLVDTIIGKNFVPAYPPYVLSLIQAQSTATVVDTSAGTHGYFYELLIRCALARESSTSEYDVTMAYLTYLATTMLRSEIRSFTTERLGDIHRAFETKIDVALDFERTLDRLTKRNVLTNRSGEVTFKYPYFFYYFVALHLRDTLGEQQTRARVSEFAKTVHVEESANILLFLAHLTRDPFVIDTLLATAKSILSDTVPASLLPGEYGGTDLALLEKETRVFLERDPDEARRKSFAEMDEAQREAEIEADRIAAQEPTSEMVRLGQSFASLQLLGQVVKNFPGTLDADRKVEIVGECYALGRRMLGWYLGLVRTNNVPLIGQVARILKHAHPSVATDKLVRQAQELVVNLVAAGTFGVVKRVSGAVGSRHLERTYKKLYDASVPVLQLFDFSLRLDHSGDFPLGDLKPLSSALDGNPLPFVVLRALVTQHLHLFPVDFRDKQAACDSLGMKYERRDLLFRGAKLLPV